MHITEWEKGGAPWMAGIADIVERIDQGVLVVRLEGNAEVNRGSNGRRAQTIPFRRDSIPFMLHVHVVPTWYNWCRETAKGSGDEGR